MNRVMRPVAFVGTALAIVGMTLSSAAIAQTSETTVQAPGVVETTKTFEKTVESRNSSGLAAKKSCHKAMRKISSRPIVHRKLAARTITKPVFVRSSKFMKSTTIKTTTSTTRLIESPVTVVTPAPTLPLPAPVSTTTIIKEESSPVFVDRIIDQPVIIQKWQPLPVMMVRKEITSPVIIEEQGLMVKKAKKIKALKVESAQPVLIERDFSSPVIIENRTKPLILKEKRGRLIEMGTPLMDFGAL